jgi:DNA polymerase-3 subunit delta'
MFSTNPAQQTDLIGHEQAEAQLLQAANSGRLPHAWLITGAEGVGKATLAYRFAKYLLSGTKGGKNLSVAPNDASSKLVAAGSHPDLLVIERTFDEKKGRMQQDIPVENIREIANFLHLTGSQSNKRVVIIDGAGALNRFGQNAVLKILEEPPEHSLIILTVESAGQLLPTIRSRTRTIKLGALKPDQLRVLAQRSDLKADPKVLDFLIDISEGSAARLLRYAENDAHGLFVRWQSFLAAPSNRAARLQLAEACSGKDSEETFTAFLDIVFLWLHRTIKAQAMGKTGAGELRLDRLLALWEQLSEKAFIADHANLDRKAALLNMLDEAALALAA